MDPRVTELLHLELDGRLDAAGRAELDAHLAADAALRAHREELRRVERALAAAPAPELPAGFREAVLRRAKAAPRVAPGALPRRRYWRGGLALAASVLLAVAVLRVVDTGPIAPDQVSGTLAPAQPTVRAEPADGGLRLSFQVPAGPPGELVIEFAQGRRIVVPGVAPGSMTLQVAGNAEDLTDFKATLTRDDVAVAVTRVP